MPAVDIAAKAPDGGVGVSGAVPSGGEVKVEGGGDVPISAGDAAGSVVAAGAIGAGIGKISNAGSNVEGEVR